MALFVISFDGVKDSEFEAMAANPAYPNISKFMKDCYYQNNVYTTFVSNTYPIHTCIATGKHPKDHGITSNLLGGSPRGDVWAQEAGLIQSRTLWDAAAEAGLSVATISWPVTCKANIKWNLPEVHLLSGQSRIVEQLRNGSTLFQLRALQKHGKKLDGIKEPNLDDFFVSVAVDLIKEKRKSRRPDLLFLHLLAYDSICHDFGLKSKELDVARASLDISLGAIMRAAQRNDTIIIFSDHGHIDIDENIDLNIFGRGSFDMVGGSAFALKPIEGMNSVDSLDEFARFPWFGRFLTPQELELSGYASKSSFGIAAKVGYGFADSSSRHKANHGFPRDYPDYKVFYSIKNGKKDHSQIECDDIRAVTSIIANELNLKM